MGSQQNKGCRRIIILRHWSTLDSFSTVQKFQSTGDDLTKDPKLAPQAEWMRSYLFWSKEKSPRTRAEEAWPVQGFLMLGGFQCSGFPVPEGPTPRTSILRYISYSECRVKVMNDEPVACRLENHVNWKTSKESYHPGPCSESCSFVKWLYLPI